MRRIAFSDVGVIVNSMQDVDELHLTYTALGIPIEDTYKEAYEKSQVSGLKEWFIQATRGDLTTTLDGSALIISLIQYPIKYSMESLDFAIACQLLMSNQEAELKVHLAQHCEEYK